MAPRSHAAILAIMIMRATIRVCSAVLAVAIAVTAPALAADKKPAPEKLPGVEGDYRIVKPYAPEPEPDDAAAAKTGTWDVTVSGTLTFDVGAGRLPLPRR
jgi:hypothetical protein